MSLFPFQEDEVSVDLTDSVFVVPVEFSSTLEVDTCEEEVVDTRRLRILCRASAVVGRALRTVIITCLLIFFVFGFILFGARVSSGSMEPTLMTDCFILVGRYQTFFSENRGLEYRDIVVFRSNLISLAEAMDLKSGEYGEDVLSQFPVLMIKRVIGLPGDTIRIDEGVVYRNGVIVYEPYVFNSDYISLDEFVVPRGEIFVLGDNRADSYDGRFWEKRTIPLDTVVGEVIHIWV